MPKPWTTPNGEENIVQLKDDLTRENSKPSTISKGRSDSISLKDVAALPDVAALLRKEPLSTLSLEDVAALPAVTALFRKIGSKGRSGSISSLSHHNGDVTKGMESTLGFSQPQIDSNELLEMGFSQPQIESARNAGCKTTWAAADHILKSQDAVTESPEGQPRGPLESSQASTRSRPSKRQNGEVTDSLAGVSEETKFAIGMTDVQRRGWPKSPVTRAALKQSSRPEDYPEQ